MVVGCALTVGGLVAAPRTTWDGVFTDEQAQQGDAVYQEHCATCHGSDLEGGEDAPSLVGAPFSAIWEGRTLGDLVDRVQRRMPFGAPGSLSRDAYTDIVALMLRRNGFPAGTRPLPADASLLHEIRYRTSP